MKCLLAALLLATRGARAVPSGFSENQLFKDPFMTDITFAPQTDTMFVTLKLGIVRVHEPGEQYEYDDEYTALDIEDLVCYENERGLGGIQLHPNFTTNNWIYLYYTFPKNGNCDEDADNGPVNRLSRWIYDPATRTIDANSEVVLLDTPSCAKAQHNAGKIEFGKDGYMYVSTGETGVNDESQDLGSVLGGMLRLTDTGDIPPDNPFANDANSVRCNVTGRSGDSSQTCQELYALGLRNPFRFAMDPNTPGNKVRFFVNDVGASDWEEISEGGDDFRHATQFGWEKGIQNFGWPRREGPCKRGTTGDCDDYEGYIHPVHYYRHEGGGAATAGAFVPNGVWPAEYDNKYLYADFVFGKIYSFGDDGEDCAECSPAKSNKDPETFLSYDDIITMRFGPYVGGQTALYYTSVANGGVMRQVVCEDCVAVTDDANMTAAPTASPTMYVPPSRPDGEGGYPGVLFPWSTGGECPEGYDYCGVLEFCMGESTLEFGPKYGYRLPCVGDGCKCESVPGPLIRVVPGNKYRLTLRNAGTEVTNLHTHGLHIVGDGDGDDVIREVMGGGNCLDYTWDIKEDHPGGTNWYHAHFHGISEKQVGGGAYGMLIVEDNTNLDPVLPTWAGNELLLQVAVAVYTDEMYANGRKTDIIDIAANQWYRLRVSLVNANALPYNFTFGDEGMCDIHKVAQDGVWRSVVPGPISSVWELTGASRADFAIRCNTPNSLIPVFYRDDELVAQIWVGAEEFNLHVMEEFTPNRPYSISDMLGEDVPESNRFSVRLGFDYVNDEYWNPIEPIATIAYDQVHEWTLMQTWFHPFHMHLYHMQIATPGGCGAHEEGEFYDTISAPSNCTIRFRTADIGQRCVLHCHVLFHEDSGSMSWVNVTGEGMPVNTEQSFEYACPAGTLPTQGPTSAPLPTMSPTQSPTFANRCVPGFLGITTDSPLLDNGMFVNEEFGVYIIQQGDGNLVVYRGTPDNRGETVWAHGEQGTADTYFARLSGDSNLATIDGTPGSEGAVLWEAGIANPDGQYFLGIDCNSEIVSIYAGDPDDLASAVAVWNSAPTTPPTAFPTLSPTTANPTVPPTMSPTVPPGTPTASPTTVSATDELPTAEPAPTSAATELSVCLSVLALLLLYVKLL